MNNIPTYQEIISLINEVDSADESIFIAGLQSTDEHVVWHAAKACGLKKIKKAISKLFELLGKKCIDMDGTDVRRISAWSLSQYDFSEISILINQFYNSTNVLMREGISDLLGLIKDNQVLPLLDELMNDSEDNVLLWASLSLSKHKDEAVSIIKKHLNKTNNLNKNIYLLDALKKIGSERAIKLVKNYKTETNNNDEIKFIESFLI